MKSILKVWCIALLFMISSVCFAEGTKETIPEIVKAIDVSDSKKCKELLAQSILTNVQKQELLAIAQDTVKLRKKATQSLFKSSKDTIFACITGALALYGVKLAYNGLRNYSRTLELACTLENGCKLLSYMTQVVMGCAITLGGTDKCLLNINLQHAYHDLHEARLIENMLKS